MYFIYKPTEDMWLLGHQPGGCGVPTCIWGTRWQDALPFEHNAEAQRLAERIGRCEIVHRRCAK